MQGLSDAELRAPSALPDWTRAHVVAHLSRNAEALLRLVHWAATGEVTPMYPNLESRAADIEATAQEPPAVLRAELTATAALLDQRLSALDEAGWAGTVRSALGRELTGAGIPWMRIREVWLHAIDLDAGIGTVVFPRDLLVELLDDVVGGRRQAGLPAGAAARHRFRGPLDTRPGRSAHRGGRHFGRPDRLV